MSEEKTIIVEEPKKPSLFERIKRKFSRTPDMHETWNRMKKEGGLIPLFDMDQTESRRSELRLVLSEIQEDFFNLDKGNCYECQKVKGCAFFNVTSMRKDLEKSAMMELLKTPKECCRKIVSYEEDVMKHKIRTVNRVYALFFSAGSAWYRGLDDRELAGKVKAFLELWNYVGDNDVFVDDLFMCAMQLLNLSWKALDVTNVPPYIIEAKTTYEIKGPRAEIGDVVEKLK